MENETIDAEHIYDTDEAGKAVISDDGKDLVGGSLLQHLDGVFGPLMAYCDEHSDLAIDAVPQLDTDPHLVMSL